MDFILESVRGLPSYRPLLDSLLKVSAPASASGVCEDLRPAILDALVRDLRRPLVILTPDERSAAKLYNRMNGEGARVMHFPARDWFYAGYDAGSLDFGAKRLEVLCALIAGEADAVISSVEAACQRTLPDGDLKSAMTQIRPGDELAPEKLCALLDSLGYTRSDRVEGKGQYSLRGGIADVFVTVDADPVRLEFFGDTVDTVRSFDVLTQRSTGSRELLRLCPADEFYFDDKKLEIIRNALKAELMTDRSPEAKAMIAARLEETETKRISCADCYLELTHGFSTLFDYCGGAVFALTDSELSAERHKLAMDLLKETVASLTEQDSLPVSPGDRLPLAELDLALDIVRGSPCVCFESFTGRGLLTPSGVFRFESRPTPDHGGSFDTLKEMIAGYLEEKRRVFYAADNSMAQKNLLEKLSEAGIPAAPFDGAAGDAAGARAGAVWVYAPAPGITRVTGGFELPEIKAVFLSDAVGEKRAFAARPKPKKKSARETIVSYADLEPGDYVVHEKFGIGIYDGIEKIPKDGALRDFVKIRYAGSDVLYVPCSNLENLSKYIGAGSDNAKLKLSKMGGEQWTKTKSRAKKAAADIAKELVTLYARRSRQKGHAFSPDSPWQEEFEEAFEYQPTEDQLRAADEIKKDMERSVPMDRLLCGDVGFGKTEIAMRAVFKCIMDGMQAAILAPTTILSWQHYQTALSRFRGYPVKIGLLNRFCSPKEIKKTLSDLKNGALDLVIGTHRLLQNDVEFFSLGLLVVDEEQRFGVTHKEKIKEKALSVDVLTLTATPIPRTLNMALGGIKDMSVLEEAPGDRFPVQTYVTPFDQGLLNEAIRKELRREGQVFWLHNNTEQLPSRAAAIAEAFPEARVGYAHGKMDKDELNRVWRDMMDHKLDVLVCTTIIETGVDVPSANTLIIENADRFGLSQLHQIRGRVGRSDRKAYAFFTYKAGKELTEIAAKRLKAIREYTQFGSGFKLALRDLELRGAGNLLGAQQHGHIESVGYDLFMQLLDRAVREEKGERAPEKTECLIDLAVDAFIPSEYVTSSRTRIDIYKKISNADSPELIEDVKKELEDRFGKPPRTVENLFAIASLKLTASQIGIEKLSSRDKSLLFYWPQPDGNALSLLGDVYTYRLILHLSGKPYFEIRMTKDDVLVQTDEILAHLKGFCEKKV